MTGFEVYGHVMVEVGLVRFRLCEGQQEGSNCNASEKLLLFCDAMLHTAANLALALSSVQLDGPVT